MNYFEKKQWIRLAICAVVVLAVTLLVSGLIGDNLKYNLKEETPKVEAGDYKYSSTQETNFSTITVYANAEDGKITDCRIASEDKGGAGNDLLTDEIRDSWAKAIAESGNADTDVITGATLTFSAKAVTDAVNDIVSQAGGGATRAAEPDNESPEKQAETTPETETAPEPEEKSQPESGDDAEYSYSSEQETNFSFIRVYANAADGKITECKIASEAKSEGSDFLTDEIRTEWAKAIVEKGDADTDVITGATKTLSAKAVTDAVNDILAQASGGETKAAEPEKGDTEKPADADPEKKDEPARESTGKQVSEVAVDDSRVLYGSYTAKRETNYSIIRVSANTKGGQITECKITSEAKMEGSDFLTDEIKDAWAKAIVENGTAETDVITGATLSLSSAAVVDAVNEILAQASGGEVKTAEPDKADPEKPAGEDPEKKDEPAREPTGKQVTEVAVDASRVLYGSYTAKRETNYSIIRVSVNTKGGQITECKITSEAKSEGSDFLTDEIKDAWAKAIVENGTAVTDAITGATLSLSSAAVVDAVNEILGQIR